ncbi:MAG: dihydroneopterin aldolase [Candidatus Paceibacterota bacterium]
MKATIKVKDLSLEVCIGAYPEERGKKQKILCDIDISTDISDVVVSDNLEDALDYMERVNEIQEYFSQHSPHLIETAASAIADMCLKHPRAEHVRVLLKKPSILEDAEYAGICIEKGKGVE